MSALHAISIFAALSVASCGERPETSNASPNAAHPAVTVQQTLAHRPEPPPLAPGRAVVCGLTIGTQDTAVERLLGAPVSRGIGVYDPLSEDTLHVWRYRDLDVQFTGQEISDVRSRRTECGTPDSLRIGASRSTVLNRYGPGIPDTLDGRLGLLYMVKGWACGLRFAFSADTVGQIELRCFD